MFRSSLFGAVLAGIVMMQPIVSTKASSAPVIRHPVTSNFQLERCPPGDPRCNGIGRPPGHQEMWRSEDWRRHHHHHHFHDGYGFWWWGFPYYNNYYWSYPPPYDYSYPEVYQGACDEAAEMLLDRGYRQVHAVYCGVNRFRFTAIRNGLRYQVEVRLPSGQVYVIKRG